MNGSERDTGARDVDRAPSGDVDNQSPGATQNLMQRARAGDMVAVRLLRKRRERNRAANAATAADLSAGVVDAPTDEATLAPETGAENKEAELAAEVGNDPALQLLLEDINRGGVTPDVEARIKDLSVRALARLLDRLKSAGNAPNAVAATQLVTATKKEKEKHGSLMPHKADGPSVKQGKGKEHYSGKETWGALENDTNKPADHEMTYDRVRGSSEGATLTGGDANAHETSHQAHKKQADEEEQKSRSRLGKKAQAYTGTLASWKPQDHEAAAVNEKSQFGDQEGWGGDVHGQAADVKSTASGELALGAKKGVKVSGNAGGTATLVGGGAKLHMPPRQFQLGQEEFRATAEVGVDAAALAEAKGSLGLNASVKGAGLEVGVEGFIGAKATGSATGTVDWIKKSPDTYASQISQKLESASALLGHVLPASVVAKIPVHAIQPMIHRILTTIFRHGGQGDSLVLGASAKGEASVGIGGAASLEGMFKNGVIHAHGKAGMTFGAGIGGSYDLQLDVINFGTLSSVLALDAGDALLQALGQQFALGQWVNQHKDTMLHSISDYCQEASHDPANSKWVQMIYRALGDTAAVEAVRLEESQSQGDW